MSENPFPLPPLRWYERIVPNSTFKEPGIPAMIRTEWVLQWLQKSVPGGKDVWVNVPNVRDFEEKRAVHSAADGT